MKFDLLFVYRHRLLMPVDPATRVLSSAIKRSYSQHAATQSSSRAQNALPPPAKRHRGAASSGAPFSSAYSTSKRLKLATHPSRSFDPGPSSSSPRQNAKRGSLQRSKKKPVVQPKTVLPGPYYNETFIEKKHKTSLIALKPFHALTPKSSLNNFYQVVAGKAPEFTTIDGVVEGTQQIYVHR